MRNYFLESLCERKYELFSRGGAIVLLYGYQNTVYLEFIGMEIDSCYVFFIESKTLKEYKELPFVVCCPRENVPSSDEYDFTKKHDYILCTDCLRSFGKYNQMHPISIFGCLVPYFEIMDEFCILWDKQEE